MSSQNSNQNSAENSNKNNLSNTEKIYFANFVDDVLEAFKSKQEREESGQGDEDITKVNCKKCLKIYEEIKSGKENFKKLIK